MTSPAQSLESPQEVFEVARILDDNKAEDIRILNLTGIHSYLDFFVIATALSPVHLKKLSNDILSIMKPDLTARRPDEKDLASGWVVLDFRDFVVHLFERETRDHFNLEQLWKSAAEVEWRQSGSD